MGTWSGSGVVEGEDGEGQAGKGGDQSFGKRLSNSYSTLFLGEVGGAGGKHGVEDSGWMDTFGWMGVGGPMNRKERWEVAQGQVGLSGAPVWQPVPGKNLHISEAKREVSGGGGCCPLGRKDCPPPEMPSR